MSQLALGAQWLAQLGTGAKAEHQRNRTEQGSQGGHDDRPEAGQACLVDGLLRRHAVVALRFQGEVDEQDAVLLDDADQQHHTDQPHDAEVLTHGPEQNQCTQACRRQGRDDGQRVDEALVEHTKDDVHRHQRGEDQPRLARQ